MLSNDCNDSDNKCGIYCHSISKSEILPAVQKYFSYTLQEWQFVHTCLLNNKFSITDDLISSCIFLLLLLMEHSKCDKQGRFKNLPFPARSQQGTSTLAWLNSYCLDNTLNFNSVLKWAAFKGPRTPTNVTWPLGCRTGEGRFFATEVASTAL